MTGLTYIHWPATRTDPLPAALTRALPGAIEIRPAARGAGPRTLDGPWLAVQADYLPTAVAAYDRARRSGPDDRAAFGRFAAGMFDRWHAFRARWGGRDGGRLVARRRIEEAASGGIAYGLGHVLPDLLADGAAIEELAAEIAAAIRPAPCPAPESFRHYDEALFRTLSRLRLPRRAVDRVFGEMLGRRPDDATALHFQTAASVTALRETLAASREYALKTPASPPRRGAGHGKT